ncbi:MAG: PspC domain-containing protein [bacterium]|nr:PspC domain-containing protein [bacterium]MDY2650203.1 PspC domain-containing protein [Candidatus Egerieousia sp.]MDY5319207.1 PspC domain-containing protein [Candidatus Egerieousia sp.]
MKEVMNIGIGGKSFVVETSAYEILRDYLELFSSKIKPGESSEVMEDIESRIAELCSENISAYKNVVTESIVVKIVTQLGLPNGESYRPFQGAAAGAANGAAGASAGTSADAATGTSAGTSAGAASAYSGAAGAAYGAGAEEQRVPKKLFRDSDDKMIGGVCSGLGFYLGADPVLVRVLFLIALLFGTLGFWVYLIIWIVAPLAVNPVQKCEMRGLAPTAENLGKFSNKSK